MLKKPWLMLGVAALVVSLSSVAGARPRRPDFTGRLTAAAEVQTPPVQSAARGTAVLRLERDGSRIHVEIVADRIDKVVAAHLHLGAAGENGPVIATIYNGSGSPTGLVKGVLACRTITNNDISGLSANTLEELVNQIEQGNIYVNVHSSDFPLGEIRGQLAGR